jgi:hypothetical protein
LCRRGNQAMAAANCADRERRVIEVHSLRRATWFFVRLRKEPPICSAVKAPTPPCVGALNRVICVGWERLPALA